MDTLYIIISSIIILGDVHTDFGKCAVIWLLLVCVLPSMCVSKEMKFPFQPAHCRQTDVSADGPADTTAYPRCPCPSTAHKWDSAPHSYWRDSFLLEVITLWKT